MANVRKEKVYRGRDVQEPTMAAKFKNFEVNNTSNLKGGVSAGYYDAYGNYVAYTGSGCGGAGVVDTID